MQEVREREIKELAEKLGITKEEAEDIYYENLIYDEAPDSSW